MVVLDLFDDEVLRALPEREAPELRETLVALGHGREMIAGELADLAREERRAIREQDLGLGDPAWVEEDLAGRGMAGVVLVGQAVRAADAGR